MGYPDDNLLVAVFRWHFAISAENMAIAWMATLCVIKYPFYWTRLWCSSVGSSSIGKDYGYFSFRINDHLEAMVLRIFILSNWRQIIYPICLLHETTSYSSYLF